MSLYHEAADLLTAPNNAGGSLKSRIFSSKTLKSQPAQIYALVIETCKWSAILKEVVENSELLDFEHKLTPVLSLLLVHDLLLAKKGIALPATHGLRTATERHKARLQAELTKARLARKLGSVEALKQYVDSGEEGGVGLEPPHPRWIRINTLKTQLEDQLETTFADYRRVGKIDAVRQRDSRCVYVDVHVPNLIAVPSFVDLSKSEAYTSGAIIFQDKASCFPAYLLDPLPEDGDIIDTCAAPGNKTTHLAAIMTLHAPETDNHVQRIHAFEKDKTRAETLKKMVALAGCDDFTVIHAAQDFLKTDPNAPEYRTVGALLLDPSCSGSGILGRDEMPILHLPSRNESPAHSSNKNKMKTSSAAKESLKRKRTSMPGQPPPPELSKDDDNANNNGILTPTTTSTNSSAASDLQSRLAALSAFQVSLVQHAMAFPSAHKISYSTCSVHAAENEDVVARALATPVARERGWRILRREEQVRGLREWEVRGLGEGEVAEACVRAHKGDGNAAMGFFVAGFVREGSRRGWEVREGESQRGEKERVAGLRRDQRGFIVRDLFGMPVMGFQEDGDVGEEDDEEEEWNGFDDDDGELEEAGGEDEYGMLPIEVDVRADGLADTGKGSKKRKRKVKK